MHFFSIDNILGIITGLIFFFIALSITTVVCGYIDLMKIKPPLRSKGKVLDITDIITRFLFIILIFLMMRGEVLAA